MAQKPKSLQDIFRERRMKDMKRDYYFDRLKRFWTAAKRLLLVAMIGYGARWNSKNPETLKSFFMSHTAPVQDVSGNFKEGMNMIKDTLKTTKESQAYHEKRHKQIKEYRDMGIDPVVKYAEAGTKEYHEELEFYRKAGVFQKRH